MRIIEALIPLDYIYVTDRKMSSYCYLGFHSLLVSVSRSVGYTSLTMNVCIRCEYVACNDSFVTAGTD